MELSPDHYYHLYNRSNNNEIVFKGNENYKYFLRKYQYYFQNDLDTIAYCLMPTHFHFLISIKSNNITQIKKNIGTLLSAYTKAINVQYKRHGSLFQEHTKARLINDDSDLITVVTYIHQNPFRAGLVAKLNDWPHSSYLDYLHTTNSTLVNKKIVQDYFRSVEEFKDYSDQRIQQIKTEYWIQ